MRLVGCTAAIRLHKLRTGKYPASLEALQLGEMIIDPFSGKPFVYKTDPRFGFLLYSVSENRVDDGGQSTYSGAPEAQRRPLACGCALARPPERRAPRAAAAGCPHLAEVAQNTGAKVASTSRVY
jgi:hypothetical protein